MQKTMEKQLPPARRISLSLRRSENRWSLRKASAAHFFNSLNFKRMGSDEVLDFLSSEGRRREKEGEGALAADCMDALVVEAERRGGIVARHLLADYHARKGELAADFGGKSHHYVEAYLHSENEKEPALAEKCAYKAMIYLDAYGRELENREKWMDAAKAFAKAGHIAKKHEDKALYHDHAYQNFARADEPLLAAKQAHAAFDELKSARAAGYAGEEASDLMLYMWAERAGRNYWNAHDRIDPNAAHDREEAVREMKHLMELVREMGWETNRYKPLQTGRYGSRRSHE